jgi:plasmid stabilization system protein ParE
MAAKLIFATEVSRDIHAAYDWYECQRRGLGEEFLRCVDACLRGISREPELHEKVQGECRRSLLRRFPYAVFYEYGKEVVTVYGVLHTSRDPEKWQRRVL